MRGRILTFLTIVAVLFVMPKRLLAQDRPAPIAEAVVGGSGFNRRGLGLLHHGWRRCPLVRHAATGNRARGFLSERQVRSVEPHHHGNITFDFIRDDGRRPVVPYLAAGGGYMRQKTLVGTRTGSDGARDIHVERSHGVGRHWRPHRPRLGCFRRARVSHGMGTRDAHCGDNRDKARPLRDQRLTDRGCAHTRHFA